MKILHTTQPPSKPKVIEVVLDGFLGRFIYRHKRAATTIPLPFLTLILYFIQPPPEIRTHEFVHVEQRQALGLIGFWVSYLTNTIKFGYAKNPMELAAYEVQAERPLPSWST